MPSASSSSCPFLGCTEDQEHVEGGAEAEGSDDDTEEGTTSDSEDSEEEHDAGEREQGEASTSSVVCVTADFAMQNVILQMGLRLASPDGRLIQQTRRWALRCTACFQVSKVKSHPCVIWVCSRKDAHLAGQRCGLADDF